MKRLFLITALAVFVAAGISGVCSGAEAYKVTRWDKVAKNVLFTVTQESQLKAILADERNAIMETRSDAAEKVIKTLDQKQRLKWDALYQKSEKQKGYVGEFRRRQLINPLYLESDFTLNQGQRQIVFYVYWDYCRKVETIRAQARGKIEKTLSAYQMNQWDREIHRPLEQEAIRNERRLRAETAK